jgi:hypothetical protein
MTTTLYKIRVYKIWYEDCPEEFYIGSTKETHLSERMTEHRKSCRKGKGANLYIRMREKGINEFKYVQIAWANVSSKEEQRQIEQTYIDQLKPTLNMIRAFRSEEYLKEYTIKKKQKYRKEHKEQLSEKSKEYYQEHKEHITDYNKHYRENAKNMRTCICGTEYNIGKKYNIEKHFQSKKHQEHVKLIWEKIGGFQNFKGFELL